MIVERLEAEERTAAGIIIPDTAQEKPQSGRVIAAGPGLRDKKNKFVPLDVKKGDEVLFAKFGGTDVTLTHEGILSGRLRDGTERGWTKLLETLGEVVERE